MFLEVDFSIHLWSKTESFRLGPIWTINAQQDSLTLCVDTNFMAYNRIRSDRELAVAVVSNI